MNVRTILDAPGEQSWAKMIRETRREGQCLRWVITRATPNTAEKKQRRPLRSTVIAVAIFPKVLPFG